MGSLSGKTALIFGGSGGFGMETAKLFIADGAAVVISSNKADRDQEVVELLRSLGGQAEAISGDYTDPAFIDAAFDAAIRWFGVPDIIVNTAGMGGGDALGEVTYERMEQIMRVNVVSPYIVMQKAIGLLQEAGKPGKVINLGSLRSHFTGKDGNNPVYASSKAAIRWLAESTARVLHRPGNRIAVSVVCPGAANTEMNLGPSGAPRSDYMHPATVARCILAAAVMPDDATLLDMTMLCTEQNPW